MNKLVVLAACAAVAAPAIASAQSGGGRNTNSVGYCISEGFYGNEPNQADGSTGGPSEQPRGGNARGGVVPSQSPGPKVTEDDGSVRDGASIGEANRLLRSGAAIGGITAKNAPEFCRALGFGHSPG
jgi:hypothetical protein